MAKRLKRTTDIREIEGSIPFSSIGDIMEDKWLDIIELTQIGKTRRFRIDSKCSHCRLGEIKWYSPWRHYCFFPIAGFETIYSDRCLETLSKFISKLNEEHKALMVIKHSKQN